MCRETSSSRAPSATQKSNIHILFGHARWVKLTHSISSDMWHVWAEIRQMSISEVGSPVSPFQLFACDHIHLDFCEQADDPEHHLYDWVSLSRSLDLSIYVSGHHMIPIQWLSEHMLGRQASVTPSWHNYLSDLFPPVHVFLLCLQLKSGKHLCRPVASLTCKQFKLWPLYSGLFRCANCDVVIVRLGTPWSLIWSHPHITFYASLHLESEIMLLHLLSFGPWLIWLQHSYAAASVDWQVEMRYQV